jgi:hypothetical protein
VHLNCCQTQQRNFIPLLSSWFLSIAWICEAHFKAAHILYGCVGIKSLKVLGKNMFNNQY